MMIQQDRNRDTVNQELITDLEKIGEVKGPKASRSMYLSQDRKSISNAEKDRVKMSS